MKRLALLFALLAVSSAKAVVSVTNVGNFNYNATLTDVRLVPSQPITVARTWTLPSAAATQIGSNVGFPAQGQGGATALEIFDVYGNVGGSNACILVAPQSGETINGSSGTQSFCTPYGRATFVPISGSQWYLQTAAQAPTPAQNVISLICGGVDDTTAIQNWATKLASGVTLSAPSGTCVFKSPITFGAASPSASIVGGSVVGQGLTTVFKYEGTSTTANLFTFGFPSTNYEFDQPFIANFRITSSTQMTAGAGILLYKVGRGFISGVYADGQDGTGNLYNGFVCAGCNEFNIIAGAAQVQEDALQVYSIYIGPGCYCGPVYVTGGKYSGSVSGIHLASLASVTVDAADIIGNTNNILIDTAQSTACGCSSTPGNQAFYQSASAFIDSAVTDNVHINDPSTSIGNKVIALYGSVGTAGGVGVNVVDWHTTTSGNSYISIFGTVADATSDGIKVQDTSALVTIEPSAYINFNGGYGVNCTSSTTNVTILTAFFTNNTSGNIASNCNNLWASPAKISVPAGAVSSGGLQYSGNAGSGLYFPTTTEVDLIANGTSALKAFSGGFSAANGPFQLKGYTVSSLPAAPGEGYMAYVSDAMSCSKNGSLTGGGSTPCVVWYNGSAWVGS